MSKNGQITIILVILLIVLIAFSFFFCTSKEATDIRASKDTQKIIDSGIDIDQLQYYGDACAGRIISDEIDKACTNKNTFNSDNSHGTGIPDKYLLPYYTNVINASIKDKFKDCFNLPFFGTVGYAFSFPPYSLQAVSLGHTKIYAKMNYRVTANYRDNKGTLTQFQHVYMTPFGSILISSQQLVDSAQHRVSLLYDNVNLSTICSPLLHGNLALNITPYNLDYVRVTHKMTNLSFTFNYTYDAGASSIKWVGSCP